MKNHVHALNSSASKQKYSFGKADRFRYDKAKTDVSYLPKIDHDRRSAIIGYGQRSLEINKESAKYPHAYSIPSTLEFKKGNSLKAGRYEIGGPLGHLKYSKQLPGPNYNIPSTLDNRGPSLKSRKAELGSKLKEFIPGPGAYDLPSSIDNGSKSVFESKFVSGGSMKIPPKEYRSIDMRIPRYEKMENPGPGQYDIMKYGISNPESPVGNLQRTKFGHEQRPGLENKASSRVPGPGQYKLYSEFD